MPNLKLSPVAVSVVVRRFPTPYLDNQTEFQLAVRTWASTLSSVQKDEYGILSALPNFGFAYDHICKTSNNHSKEHTQCRSIDDIIELASSARVDCHCDFKYIFSPRAFAYISYNLAIRTEESYRLAIQMRSPTPW